MSNNSIRLWHWQRRALKTRGNEARSTGHSGMGINLPDLFKIIQCERRRWEIRQALRIRMDAATARQAGFYDTWPPKSRLRRADFRTRQQKLYEAAYREVNGSQILAMI